MDAESAKFISGAKALLKQLQMQQMEVPDELLRVQELVECVDNNAQKIAAALVTSRRPKTNVGSETTAELLREQRAYISQVGG
ncbi:hypothetical protein PHMEG_00011882 [Phytophthora megakarya]|uniref:Uncharacterized protein n=1 Tax=Phytophthora megakarya TaxID=4795 RepID=A0A225WBU5_9STRA|nr:hypothetical protein PHMEG_00011882 [Phytophthora megakarya]